MAARRVRIHGRRVPPPKTPLVSFSDRAPTFRPVACIPVIERGPLFAIVRLT